MIQRMRKEQRQTMLMAIHPIIRITIQHIVLIITLQIILNNIQHYLLILAHQFMLVIKKL